MTSDHRSSLPDPYRVRRGDTLSAIAVRCGKTVQELKRLNGLRDANRLRVGQTLYLSKDTAFGVSVQFLDAYRHPIQNIKYRLEFDGKAISGATQENGLTLTHVTESAISEVKVWVQQLDGAWQQTARFASEYGHKLVTLVSNAIVVAGETKKIAESVWPRLHQWLNHVPASPRAQQAVPQQPTGECKAQKNNPAVKTKSNIGKAGQPLISVQIDIPPGLTDLFSSYVGGEISDREWKAVAADLGCEPEVLKAFSEVESGGKSSFWRMAGECGANVPAILYERHYFSRLTAKKHDKSHPDLSWPTGYRKKKQIGDGDKKMHDGRIDADDVYSDYASSYLRLINAYRLNPDAALASCSWGKFQIMGANFKLCGEVSIQSFVRRMCTSELEQIKLLADFIRQKPAAWRSRQNKDLGKFPSLLEAVRSKDWEMIAYNYNGPGYKVYNYHSKIRTAYDKHKKVSEKTSKKPVVDKADT